MKLNPPAKMVDAMVVRRFFFVLAAAFAMAGCGGGGGSVQPKGTATAPPTSSAARAVIGRGTLTVQFPPSYRTAKSSVRNTGASKSRKPAYVNPTAGNLLDVYINGTLVTNLDGITPSHSATVAPSSDGTQSLTNVPLYSTNTDVAVIEWDSSDSLILAVGENPTISFTPGTAATLSVMMQMNATGFALTPNADGSSGTVFGSSIATGSAGSPEIVYVYPVDPLGGFTAASGYGGYPSAISVTGTSSDDSKIGLQPRPGYLLSYASLSSSVSVTATAPNPAYFLNKTGYPELIALYYGDVVNFSTITGSSVISTVTLVPSLPPFFYTGGAQYAVVPAGITQATVTVAGAQGSGGNGGYGGSVTATIPVTPGETLTINVGGIGGYNGSGASGGDGCGSPGGDGSDVRQGGGALGNRVVVGGGGGGGGCDNGFGGGAGGSGGQSPFNGGNVGGAGGGGGGLAGSNLAGGLGGLGGPGAPGGSNGADGALGFGGSGGAGSPASCTGLGGSGGGGGYYGGGGGGGGGQNAGCTGGYGGGGGGGGSSWAEGTATGVTYNDGAQFGNGQVTIVF